MNKHYTFNKFINVFSGIFVSLELTLFIIYMANIHNAPICDNKIMSLILWGSLCCIINTACFMYVVLYVKDTTYMIGQHINNSCTAETKEQDKNSKNISKVMMGFIVLLLISWTILGMIVVSSTCAHKHDLIIVAISIMNIICGCILMIITAYVPTYHFHVKKRIYSKVPLLSNQMLRNVNNLDNDNNSSDDFINDAYDSDNCCFTV